MPSKNYLKLTIVFLLFARCSASAEETVLLWGDTHLHTSNSTDAYENGRASVGLEDAYRFARGLPVIQPATRTRIRIDRPLDFLVIADHAEMMGLPTRLLDNDPAVMATNAGQKLKKMMQEDPFSIWRAQIAISLSGANQDMVEQLHVPPVIRGAWEAQIAAADRHNIPGEFTALIGWEWSSSSNDTNLHRVIFTPDDGKVARKFLPISSYDSDRPEDLWRWLEQTELETGARFVAIPHNSNISQGLMFSNTDSQGNAMTLADAEFRLRWEPVIEVTQYKGTSETHPVLAPTDEFAAFELREFLFSGQPAEPLPGSYIRPALRTGLLLEQELGVNPYRLGMIGSTDSHTGLASVEENNFMGKSGLDTLPEDRPDKTLGLMSAWEVSASGLAGVWAEENSREGIFNAFMRREVFATSGPRISLRVFGSFNFPELDPETANIASVGYRDGVPMGSDLLIPKNETSFSLLIEATSDPASGNLDRVQVIKGWIDETGNTHEKIYNVSWAGERILNANGKLPAIETTVDVSEARYENREGSPRLAVIWQDPDFSSQPSFYYVRVLEVPTPRHHVYDAAALGLDTAEANPGKSLTIQERAWSSPIWLTP